MKHKPEKIDTSKLGKIFKDLKEKPDTATGNFLFNGYRVQITRYNISNAERIKLFFQDRRNKGLCKRCGKKVTKINSKTGKLYRLCEPHRKMELNK